MKKKVAVISGGTSGIGKRMVSMFLKSGINRPPWLSPHTSTNMNGLIGSWSNLKGRGAIPGAWSLAHNGVLFLDEFASLESFCLSSKYPVGGILSRC